MRKMIVMGIHTAYTKTDAPAIGGTQPKADIFITILNEKGETQAEWRTVAVHGSTYRHTYTKKPRWLAHAGMCPPAIETVLIDLENLNAYAELAVAYHPALKNPHQTRPPVFREGYEKLRHYGGLFEYSPEEQGLIAKKLAMAAGNPIPRSISISNDEKYLSIAVTGEIRIYRLDRLELIDIITWDQIMKALIRAGTPRKMLRLLRSFNGIMDPAKPDTIWVSGAYRGTICVFKMEIPTRSITTDVKHIYEIIWENRLEEEFEPIKLVDKDRIYEPEYIGNIAGASPNIWGDGALSLLIRIYTHEISVPGDPKEREKLGLTPDNTVSSEVIFVDLDEELNVKYHRRWIWIEDKEWRIMPVVGTALTRGDHMIIQGSFSSRKTNEKGRPEFFRGIVMLSRKYKTTAATKDEPIIDKLIEEKDIDTEKYHIASKLLGGATASPDRGQLLLPVEIHPKRRYPSLQSKLYLAKTDWKVSKIEVVEEWLGTKKNRGPGVSWTAWI